MEVQVRHPGDTGKMGSQFYLTEVEVFQGKYDLAKPST